MHDVLNRSAESMVDLRHHRNDSITHGREMQHRRRGPHSNGGVDSMILDHLTSTYTLGDRQNHPNADLRTLKSSTIQAGNYTVDIIKKSTPSQSMLESAKFISNRDSVNFNHLSSNVTPLMIPQNRNIMTMNQLLGEVVTGGDGLHD